MFAFAIEWDMDSNHPKLLWQELIPSACTEVFVRFISYWTTHILTENKGCL